MGSHSYCIRKATPSDLDQIKALADIHKYELGFVLRPSLQKSIARQEIFVAKDLCKVIGFIEYHHRRDAQTTLYHLVVASQWRGQGIGRSLVEELKSEVVEKGKQCLLLKCPTDLPANTFYEKIGFRLIGHASGRNRDLNLWQVDFPASPIDY